METKEQIASGEIQSEKDFVFYDVYFQKVTRTPNIKSWPGNGLLYLLGHDP